MAAHKNNKYALGNKGGRPPKYETWQDLHSRIAFYFNECHQFNQPYTVYGLSLYLGFYNKKSLAYQKCRGEEFAYVIDRAYLVIMVQYEEMLFSKNWRSAIWILKNMGWGKLSHQETKEITKRRTAEEEKEYFEKEIRNIIDEPKQLKVA